MSTERQVALWAFALLVVLFGLLYVLRDILAPFVAGMAAAYLLDPVCDRLERWGLSRTLATVVVTAAFFLVLLAILLWLAPVVYGQILTLVNRLPEYFQQIGEQFRPLLEQIAGRLEGGDLSGISPNVGEHVGTVLGWVTAALKTVLSGGLALVNLLALLFITPIVAFFLLRDWDDIVGRLDKWLPRPWAGVIREQAALIDETLAGFVRGQALVCLFLGTFYAVVLTIVGLDFGITIGLFTGILSFIPYVGTTFGFVTSIAVAFAQFSEWLSIFLVAGLFIAGQAIEGNFLTPKLVGDRVGLHPVWVIFALLAGGSLFGFVGVLLAIPVAAVIGVLARFVLGRYLNSRYYRGGLPASGPPPRKGEDGTGGSPGGRL
jgi:predicted PurR-regulated permease PerM